jgi:hypothetical protein
VQQDAHILPASELVAVCGQGWVKGEGVHAPTLRQAAAWRKRPAVSLVNVPYVSG